MASISNDGKNIISKLDKDLENSEGITKSNNKSKNFLPSFLLENTEKDDYFMEQSSNCENESIEEKEENHFERIKIFDKDSVNKIDENENQNNNNKKRIIYNNGKNYNINGNYSNQNFYYSFPINEEKNFINNSFNNRNSNYYYQNYFNLLNNSNINPNILNNINKNNNDNNNINIINNNNFINQNPHINSYSNSFGNAYPFNFINYQTFFPTMNKQNNINGNLDKFNFIGNNPNNINNIQKNELNKKCLSFNLPFSPFEENPENIENNSSEKKKKKKSKKEKASENNNNNNSNDSYNITMKKLLNMTDYSLYNYLITQKGSRDVQMALKKIKENEAEILIDKLKDYISDITKDKYGNYFSQKLIQICVPSQRIKFLKYINTRFVEISNNSFGTHPLQTLMEIINMSEEKKLVLSYILGNESTLALDSKGTHVLQKFISNTVDQEREQLNKNIINLIDKLIIDPFGVCVLIKLVKHSKDKIINKKIANYITDNGPLSFIQHPYANYAVQILLNSTDLSYCENIIDTIINNYLSLSMQKFSSNVVENCIKFGDEKSVKKIYKAIIEQEKLESLLNNNYGNFVLEKLISRLNKEEKMKIIKKIEKLGKTKTLSNTLRNLLYE